MLGQTIKTLDTVIVPIMLQWRAEQLLGQTRCHRNRRRPGRGASMEGRAIARPNLRLSDWWAPQDIASMEGRAIARPNRVDVSHPEHSSACFNGGPSNCSAKPGG